MKKICLPARLGLCWLGLGLATLLLSSNLTYGYNTYNDSLLVPAAPLVASTSDTGGLTPKRAKVPVAPDQLPIKQESAVPVPVIPATSTPAPNERIRLAQASTEPALTPTVPLETIELQAPDKVTIEIAPPVVVPPVVATPVVVPPPVTALPNVAPPVETPAPRTPAPRDNDSHIYSELDRLNHEIQSLKHGTGKPDTKKAWSAPKINGRIFLDSVNFMNQNSASKRTDVNDNMQNAAGFRELRFGIAGNGYDSFDYKLELGFSPQGGQVALVDNWVGVKHIPLLGYVRAGHYKPETGLYNTMSPSNTSLMECGIPINVFGQERRIGISSENLFANDRVRLFFGVFQGAATNIDRYLREDNQGQIVNLRLTAAPWFAQEGKYLIHLGGHWEYVARDSKNKPGASLPGNTPGAFGFGIPATLRSGSFANDYSHRGGLEFAYQHGRFSARSELFAGSFGAYHGEPGRHLFGSYVELGYFLTDDFRTYDLHTGIFGAQKIKRNFHPYQHGEWNLIDSFGAWQVVFQWGYTDMNDWRRTNYHATTGNPVEHFGGYQNDFIVGLNWYWTSQMRWIFEYVHSRQCVGADYLHPNQDIFATSIRYNW